MIEIHDAEALYPSLLARALELVGNQADAEDIVQTAYLRMCEEPPATQDAVEFKRWMRTVIRNLAIDDYRQNLRRGKGNNPEIDACQVCGSHERRCGCCG